MAAHSIGTHIDTELQSHHQALTQIQAQYNTVTDVELKRLILSSLTDEKQATARWFSLLDEKNKKLFITDLLSELLKKQPSPLITGLGNHEKLDTIIEKQIGELQKQSKFVKAANKGKSLKRRLRAIHIAQFALMTAGIAIAATLFAVALIGFPPLMMPLMFGLLAVNVGKVGLGGTGLLVRPEWERGISLVEALAVVSLIAAVIFVPGFAPIGAMGLAAYTIVSESIKIAREIKALITVARKLSADSNTATPEELLAQKKERNMLALNTVERGLKIGLSVATIGLAAGAFFFPPLLFAAVAVAAVSVVGFMAYGKLAKPRLMKKLNEAAEASIKTAANPATSPASTGTAPASTPTPATATSVNVTNPAPPSAGTGAAPTPASTPVIAPVAAMTSASNATPSVLPSSPASTANYGALRRSSSMAKPTTIYMHDHKGTHKEVLVKTTNTTSSSQSGIELYTDRVPRVAKEVLSKNGEDPTDKVEYAEAAGLVTIKLANNNQINIHAHYITTNAPDDPKIIDLIAQMASELKWEYVKLGGNLTQTQETLARKQAAVTDAQGKPRLEIRDDQGGVIQTAHHTLQNF